MSLMSRETSIEVPYAQDICFCAMATVLDRMRGVVLQTLNETTGTIQASVKMSFTSLSWGDDIIVQILPGQNGLSKITLSSTAKGPAFFAGSQQSKNLSEILAAFSSELGYYDPIDHTKTFPAYSVADEIMKYKQLLDSGAITQEEYAAKKDQLLNL